MKRETVMTKRNVKLRKTIFQPIQKSGSAWTAIYTAVYRPHTAADQVRKMMRSGQLEICILKKRIGPGKKPRGTPIMQLVVGDLAGPIGTN